MSTRLQVVMEDAELEEVRQAAARARLTTSEWVRRVLREARGPADGPSRSPVLVNDRLLHLVMERYRFPTRHAAVEFALRRAAEPPMTHEEVLAMEGTGWFGDLDEIREGNRPPDVIE